MGRERPDNGVAGPPASPVSAINVYLHNIIKTEKQKEAKDNSVIVICKDQGDIHGSFKIPSFVEPPRWPQNQ